MKIRLLIKYKQLSVLRPFHYVNWKRQDNTWPTCERLVDQQLVNWSSTRHYDYIYTLWSSLSPEEKRKKRKRRRRGGKRETRLRFFLSLFLLLLNEEFIRFICYCASSHYCFLFILLIERVFVWRASVKYETDQSTLDFVSEQTMLIDIYSMRRVLIPPIIIICSGWCPVMIPYRI